MRVLVCVDENVGASECTSMFSDAAKTRDHRAIRSPSDLIAQ